MKLRRALGSFFLAAALTAIPVMAQEAAHEKTAEHEGGNMELWKWANFAILAGILGYLISKNVGPMLVTRSAEITAGLAAGEKAKAEAGTRAAAVEARLAGLEKTVAGMQSEARQEREREADRIRQTTQNEMARLKRHAEMEIESAGKLAMLDVKRHAATLALDLAEQKIKARMTPDAEKTLLNKFIHDVAATAPEARQ